MRPTHISLTGERLNSRDDLLERLLEGRHPVPPEGIDELRSREPRDLGCTPLADTSELVPLHRSSNA
jgi:hypothetical protein